MTDAGADENPPETFGPEIGLAYGLAMHFPQQRFVLVKLAVGSTSFDLIAKLLGTSGKQKQLFRKGIKNVRTHLGLGVLSLQIAMIANHIWNLPFRTISYFKGVFA